MANLNQEATSNDTNRKVFDRANANTLPDHLRKVRIGSVLAGHVNQHLAKLNFDVLGASVYNLATLDAVVLPDDQKALQIIRAYARTGTAGTGELTVAAAHATPTTGQIAVAPNGNIVALATDALTGVELVYAPLRGDAIDSVFPVAADTLTLPASITGRGVIALLEVEVVAGTATGKKIVLAPAGSPAAGQAALGVAKTTVVFAGADAVTRARVKVLVAPVASQQLQAVLQALADVL